MNEFAAHQEARRIAYHALVKSSTESMNDDNEYQNAEESNTGESDEQKDDDDCGDGNHKSPKHRNTVD